MFNLDTFRLIRNTFNRFFSLFMIVLVSSSFMMGLFSNATILRESVDAYNDSARLQDIQVYSSYGFCDEDIRALKGNEDVEYVFGSKMVDAYGQLEDSGVHVFRFEELDREVDLIELVEGRMPQNSREALILGEGVESASRLIGRKVRAFLNKEDIGDYLKNDTFTIVGTCKSPAYISKLMGSSNCENQELDSILFIDNGNFIFDYYTTIYLKLRGSEDYISYTKGYEDYIDSLIGSVESTKNRQQSYLRDRMPAILYWLVGSKLKKQFGGRIRFFGIGGAKLDIEVERFLRKCRFPYAIGYGLTETAPLICDAGPKRTHLGTTGTASYGVSVRLANVNPETGQGELQVKGPNVMLGYYKDYLRTQAVMTPDGWMRTGDMATVDKKGRYGILGRMGNVIIGASGENIYPEEIESVINNFAGVNDSLVVSRSGQLVALVQFNEGTIDWNLEGEDKFIESLE